MPTAKRKVKINSMDKTGDSVLAEYDPEVSESVDLAQDQLTDFLAKCVSSFGSTPPVWGKRIGEKEYTRIDPRSKDDLTTVEDVLIHQEVVGG